jgi:Flp pilus assembly protein TadD
MCLEARHVVPPAGCDDDRNMVRRSEGEFDRLIAEALAHHQAKRLSEAEAAYRAALDLSPGHPAVTHNLGVVAAARGDHQSAIDCFDAVIAAEPRYVSAHFNRAVALQALGQSREAIKSFERVCALEPEHYDAHRALGFLWLAEGERGRALDHFARTYELRRGEDRTRIAAKSLTTATRAKLMHDAEQFRFLSGLRRDGQRFAMLAQSYEGVAKDFPDGTAALSGSQIDRLGEDYNTAIAIGGAPELAGQAVSARPDRDAILRHFKDKAGAVLFDNLLTPPALAGLKRYLLESTIWHDFDHIDGFVASYLEDGLACPLVLQIADEIRRMFPEILSEHPLSQAWAFKGLEARAAIDAHADDAAFSVNFWVTPDAANRDPERGGLTVCLVPPPSAWQVRDYNADKEAIVTFLELHADDSLIVPYRENRAVLFNSRLFHRSDAPHFATGYENHRINLTLLFGRHGS